MLTIETSADKRGLACRFSLYERIFMENIIIVSIIVILTAAALLRAKKHFSGGGCCGGGSNTIRAHKKLTEPIRYDTTATAMIIRYFIILPPQVREKIVQIAALQPTVPYKCTALGKKW